MKLNNNQNAPQVTAQTVTSEVAPAQVGQVAPMEISPEDLEVQNEFVQSGAQAGQLVPPPSMDQSAPSTGQSLLSLQISQSGPVVSPGQIGEVDPNPRLTHVEDAADAFMDEVEAIQGRMTEELRTEDAIKDVNVTKGEHNYRLSIIVEPNSPFTPPQVEAASQALLDKLGFGDVDIHIVAPEVTPFPGFPGGGPSLAPVPQDLLPGINKAVEGMWGLGGGEIAPLAEKPNVEGLEHFLLRDMIPADGPRDEVFVDRDSNSFYLSSTIMSMMGPEHSGTNWFGPFSLD